MAYTKEQLARIWLQCAPMGAWNRLDALRTRLGGAEKVWDQFTPALYEELGEETFVLMADRRRERCQSILRRLDALNARPLFRGEDGYPHQLAVLSHPPDVLFCQGEMPPADAHAVAIVGSRNNTRYGAAQTRRIAMELARQGVVIVSGLARGIDAVAHTAALDAGGRTVAVLGSGLGKMYPAENKALAQRILDQGGAILSELGPDEPPLSYHFPVRNRIISGLSAAVLLIEARFKSGTHTTIQYALEQSREVFALPGNVDAPGSELPLSLLKDGAQICTCADDIVAYMNWDKAHAGQLSFLENGPESGAENDAENPRQESDDPILRALEREEKTLEELLDETGLPVEELSARLTILEINGLIERRAGRAYARA